MEHRCGKLCDRYGVCQLTPEYEAEKYKTRIDGIRAWQDQNTERVKKNKKAWNARNREKVNANAKVANKAFYLTHPEYKSVAKRRRKHQQRSLPHEAVNPQVVFERDGGICRICKKAVVQSDISMDHIVPMSLGGGYLYTNLQLAHRRCNSKRGAGRTPAQTRLI